MAGAGEGAVVLFHQFDLDKIERKFLAYMVSQEGQRSVWGKQHAAYGRPLVCPCSAYEWVHRRGLGACRKGMDALRFRQITGREPQDDDMERANCLQAGEIGHKHCGVCPTCGFPRFVPNGRCHI